MNKITISTFQLFQMFPDKESARVYFESRMWPNGVRCPVCEATENITTRKRVGFYRCNQCHEDFTVCTGTIFERSHIPHHRALLHAEIRRLNPRRRSQWASFWRGFRRGWIYGSLIGLAIACAWAVGWVLLFGVVTR